MINSTKYSEKLHKYIPGGAHTYSRGDDQFPSNAPPILKRGKGCHVWDAEGNKYLDYGMALRAVTIGYDDPRITKAAIQGIKAGNNLTRPSCIEAEAAERMVSLIDGMDMIKFGKNGSTVTTSAVKLARAYTGKKYIARCAEHPFFSYDDWFIGSTVMDAGIPDEIKNLTVQFNYNDMKSVRDVYLKCNGDIACFILEPATHIEPSIDFLEKLRIFCNLHGTLLIFDEMITGFRWHLKGAQHYYDVIPDLCTFGKAMANGFSVSALMGKREIMKLGGLNHEKERIFLMSTTHGAEMSGLNAMLKTIDVYERDKVCAYMAQYARMLKVSVNSIAKSLKISDYFSVEGHDKSLIYVCKDEQKAVSVKFRTLFMQEMVKNRVLMPWIALSRSHTSKDLETTLYAIYNSLKTYRNALEYGIDKYLVGQEVKSVFRKFN